MYIASGLVFSEMLQFSSVGSNTTMCSTNTSTIPQVHNRAAASTTDLQKARGLHREDRARADGRESLPSDNDTQGCRHDACDKGAKAGLGVANGAGATCDLLSIADTRSLCGVLSKACVRAA